MITPDAKDVQYGDYPLGGARIGIGFRKCKDFDPDASGQDFAIARTDGRHVAGVVADGVSQSFFGEIAAHGLGDALIENLWANRTDPPTVDQLTRDLAKMALDLDEQVRNVAIPDNLPEMLRQALEEIRVHGSQSVAAAFVYDTQNGALTIYQTGDISVLVFADGSIQGEALPPDTTGRFSTAGRSELRMQRHCHKNVDRVLLCSDGLAGAFQGSLDAAHFEPEQFEKEAGVLSGLDDVSFVWAERTAPAAAGRLPTAEPPPMLLQPVPAAQDRNESDNFRSAPGGSLNITPARLGPGLRMILVILLSAAIGFTIGRRRHSIPHSLAFEARAQAVSQRYFENQWRDLLSVPNERLRDGCSGVAVLHVDVGPFRIRKLILEVDTSCGRLSNIYTVRKEGTMDSGVIVPITGLGPSKPVLIIQAEDAQGYFGEKSVVLRDPGLQQTAYYDLTLTRPRN